MNMGVRKMRKFFVSTVLVTLLAVSPMALADDADEQAARGTMAMGGMMMERGATPGQGMMSMMGWGGMAVGTVDGHLAFLHTELGIKPDQETLWQDFAKTIRGNAEQMRSTHHWDHIYGTTNLVERLGRYEKHLSARVDMLRNTKSSLVPLYAELDEDQKSRANQILFGHMEHM
jgi:hypothetical protein